MSKNAFLFYQLVEAQQNKYDAERQLLSSIEDWFEEHDIKVKATLLDYNYVRVYSRDDNMCNFDMTAFCDEFNAEIDYYRHGIEIIDGRYNDNPAKMFWRFEVRAKRE